MRSVAIAACFLFESAYRCLTKGLTIAVSDFEKEQREDADEGLVIAASGFDLLKQHDDDGKELAITAFSLVFRTA